jgi:hypothetical protein
MDYHLTCAGCGTPIDAAAGSELAGHIQNLEEDGRAAEIYCPNCVRLIQADQAANAAEAARRTLSDPTNESDVEDFLVRIIAEILQRGLGIPIRTRNNPEEEYRLLLAPLVLTLAEAGAPGGVRGLVLRWPRGYSVRVTITGYAPYVSDQVWSELAARMGVAAVRIDPPNPN